MSLYDYMQSKNCLVSITPALHSTTMMELYVNTLKIPFVLWLHALPTSPSSKNPLITMSNSPTFRKQAHPFSTTWSWSSDCWLLLPSHKLFRTTQYEKASGTKLSSHIVCRLNIGDQKKNKSLHHEIQVTLIRSMSLYQDIENQINMSSHS
jgi:hypothetical protein